MTADASTRKRIHEALDESMVVVAGAGTGKTTVLVDRIVQLVSTHRAHLKDVAAITFTEAAAAELRQRVREALEAVSSADPADVLVRSALEEIDDAAISTLHSFAQRLLVEQCAAAGLPSGFEVFDATADARDFEARWSRFADELFDDPSAEPALVKGFVTGLKHTDLRAVARAFHDNWDRLEGIDLDPPTVEWPEVDPTPVIDAMDRALAMAGWCGEDEDILVVHLRDVVADARAQLSAAVGNEEDVLHVLSNLPPLRCKNGKHENWQEHVAEVREACTEAEEARADVLDRLRRTVLSFLVPRLAGFALRSADERRAAGTLTFHDLLVNARQLLRAGGEPLESLRRRYRWILVDEFQDTDPIQAELAARLAAARAGGDDLSDTRPGALFVVGDPKQSIYRFRRADIELFDRVGAEIGERLVLETNFRSVPAILDFVNFAFGQLFGSNPVQGQAAHDPLVPERPPLGAPDERPTVGGPVFSNGRNGAASRRGSRSPSPDQLQLPLDEPGLEDVAPPLVTSDGAQVGADNAEGARPVVVLGDRIDGAVADVRRQLAADAARCIRHVVSDGWLVAEKAPSVGKALREKLRPARFGDIAVLIPTRTSLASLEEAFEDADVPYRLEGASMLWESEDVRDVLAVLRGADDPADQVAVVAALRSPGLACGDDDLLAWHRAGGRWDPRSSPPPEMEQHPVARAMSLLSAIHHERWWSEPSALVARACDELRSFELALAHRRPRDHWQRLRWLCDQARLFDETIGGSLRSFLSWAEIKAQGDSGAAGIGPPDPDDDAVRVMTMHGAKGLEFPVVMLCGLERLDYEGRVAPVALWGDDGALEVRAGPLFQSEGYQEADERDEELDLLERIRLLYVAMTRARDHLVLCVHRRAGSRATDSSLAGQIAELCDAAPELWRTLSEEELLSIPPPPAPAGRPHDDEASDLATDAEEWKSFRDTWSSDRAALLALLRRQPVVSATSLAEAEGGASVFLESLPAATPDGPTPDGPMPDGPMPDGAARDIGLRVGRAVHNVLDSVDLLSGLDATGRSVEELSAARARSAGLEEHASRISQMARAALDTDVVRRAAARRHWKEMYVAIPIDEHAEVDRSRLFEGIVDLLYEDDDGLVVVDYKTDRITGDEGLRAAVARHSLQVGAYAAAIERATGMPVVRVVLLLLGAPIPTAHVLEATALEEAREAAMRTASALLAG